MAGSGFNPCISCGACCAFFRVSFYWAEADDTTPGGVPVELTEEFPPFRRTMKGTNQRHNMRCEALEGRIGEKVGCTIYSSRPTPCRAFEASYESGKKNKRCDDARAKYGLKPLKAEDWQ